MATVHAAPLCTHQTTATIQAASLLDRSHSDSLSLSLSLSCALWHRYTGGSSKGNLHKLGDKRVAIIGTGATAVQCVPHLGLAAKKLYVFQRTPSSIDIRNQRDTTEEYVGRVPPVSRLHRIAVDEALRWTVLRSIARAVMSPARAVFAPTDGQGDAALHRSAVGGSQVRR